MKKVFLAIALLVAVVAFGFYVPTTHAQVPKVDPIETTVDTTGEITVTHVFPDGHTQVLVQTHSISQAQAVWLDAVHTLGK
jgi:hypothetical protein